MEEATGVSTWSIHQAPTNQKKITLVVEDIRFVMEPALFTKHPDTMLGLMFAGVKCVPVNDRGEYEVAQGYSASQLQGCFYFCSAPLL